MRGGRRVAGDRQERLRQRWRGAGDASRFDSRPALSRGEGREGVRERRRPDNRGGELWGGTREGSGRRETPAPWRPGRPGGGRAASKPRRRRRRLLPTRPPLRTAVGPSRAERGHEQGGQPGPPPPPPTPPPPRQRRGGSGSGAQRAGAAAPGRARGRAGGSGSEPSNALGVRCHRRRCHHRPALTRRRSPATSADRDAPEAGPGRVT